MSINQVLAEGASRLQEAGDPNPRRSARLLLAHILCRDQASLIAHPEYPVDQQAYASYLALISRKNRGEPLQHLTGHQEFFGLDFAVTPDVLIPRPETEFLVERVIKIAGAADSIGRREGEATTFTIADIGTGSGCIAIALAVNLPGAQIVATDLSASALEIARKNAERNGVATRIQFTTGNLLDPLSTLGLKGSVDVIASNPPYIPSSRPETVQREVREFEPGLALFGGEDGLDFYRRFLREAPDYLKSSGYLVCEMGYQQLDAINAEIDALVWQAVDVTRDLQDLPRTLTLKLITRNHSC